MKHIATRYLRRAIFLNVVPRPVNCNEETNKHTRGNVAVINLVPIESKNASALDDSINITVLDNFVTTLKRMGDKEKLKKG